MITKLNNMLYGFILCALLASLTINGLQYKGLFLSSEVVQLTLEKTAKDVMQKYMDENALANKVMKESN
jgi:hypothetical protein